MIYSMVVGHDGDSHGDAGVVEDVVLVVLVLM